MKEPVLKTFWRDTYKSDSPIPFIITAQVLVFVLIHIFDLLQEIGVLATPLYEYAVQYLSLPVTFSEFITQPWSLFTFPFLYTDLFSILFDCLWLFWMGNTFMVFLNKRQFLFVFSSSLLLGGVAYLLLGLIPALYGFSQSSFTNTGSFALGAVVAATATLVPKSEIRLFLFGNVSMKTIAIVYICIELIFTAIADKPASLAFILSAVWGILYIKSLQQGNDFSLFLKSFKRSKLKVVHNVNSTYSHHSHRNDSDLPNQSEIDEILDKISVGGYESLSSLEKEILFKASKSEN
ncbi:MAG: rhomboid family intramembrane serine protease [Sphingobacterium sp.]|uniref:rhomboid family intramembrane serine protease n=1 Tax=Sphingobacterium sp. JB170 TaxID=1434842 RepID=UPI00097EB376|nr:rhomboid family intramembrane serine protease [Sphingobacterium sp. JB170]SJN15894.1 Rhomboid family protein [Sphingobacterium sp. JB170]